MPKEINENKNKSDRFDDLDALADHVDELDATPFMIPGRLVRFDVHLKGTRNLIALDPQLLREVRKRARSRNTSSENLINRWLREKLAGPGTKRKSKAG